MGRGLKYNELASCRLSETRRAVISEASKNGELIGISLGEQLTVEENGRETRVFMKSGMSLLSVNGLFELRDTLIEACQKLEQNAGSGLTE